MWISRLKDSIAESLIADLYRSILESAIRFFDRRFRDDSQIEYFKNLIERERIERSKLLDKLLETKTADLASEPEDEIPEFKPIAQPNWKMRARALEEMQRQKKEEMMKAKQNQTNSSSQLKAKAAVIGLQSIEELETELGLGVN